MEQLFNLVSDPVNWVSLATLVVMEVILGIDNLVFITILTNKLPLTQRARARRIGISLALLIRLLLLSMATAIMRLNDPVIEIFSVDFSWRDIILVGGGLFLIWKSVTEIRHLINPDHAETTGNTIAGMSFAAVVCQILALDMVFSMDSIVTAVGMTPHVPIMMVAVLVAVGAMLLAADPLADFVQSNPTLMMLALGFLLLIGTTLIADGVGLHIPRSTLYAVMGFSALMEILNMLARRARRQRRRQQPEEEKNFP